MLPAIFPAYKPILNHNNEHLSHQVLRITQEAASVDGKWIQALPHYLADGDVKIFQLVGKLIVLFKFRQIV